MGAPAPKPIPSFSPLEPIFAVHPDSIPHAFREQFLHSPDYPYGIILEGQMHHVWHRPGWLQPLFWALGKIGLLVPEFGRDLPTTLKVEPGRYADGRPFHVWNRTFQFPGRGAYRFKTTIVYDPALDQVVDLLGPDDRLYMVWRARFTRPNIFTLDTAACGLRLGGKVRWMPRWLWPWMLGVVRFVQRADPAQPDLMHIELIISHPLLGDFFGYTGSFRVRRISPSAEAVRVA